MITPEWSAALTIFGIVFSIFLMFIGVSLDNSRKRNLHLKWVEKNIPVREEFLTTCEKVRVMTSWINDKQVWFIQKAHVPHPRDYAYEYKAPYEPMIYWINSSEIKYDNESDATLVARDMAHSYFDGVKEVAVM